MQRATIAFLARELMNASSTINNVGDPRSNPRVYRPCGSEALLIPTVTAPQVELTVAGGLAHHPTLVRLFTPSISTVAHSFTTETAIVRSANNGKGGARSPPIGPPPCYASSTGCSLVLPHAASHPSSGSPASSTTMTQSKDEAYAVACSIVDAQRRQAELMAMSHRSDDEQRELDQIGAYFYRVREYMDSRRQQRTTFIRRCVVIVMRKIACLRGSREDEEEVVVAREERRVHRGRAPEETRFEELPRVNGDRRMINTKPIAQEEHNKMENYEGADGLVNEIQAMKIVDTQRAVQIETVAHVRQPPTKKKKKFPNDEPSSSWRPTRAERSESRRRAERAESTSTSTHSVDEIDEEEEIEDEVSARNEGRDGSAKSEDERKMTEEQWRERIKIAYSREERLRLFGKLCVRVTKRGKEILTEPTRENADLMIDAWSGDDFWDIQREFTSRQHAERTPERDRPAMIPVLPPRPDNEAARSRPPTMAEKARNAAQKAADDAAKDAAYERLVREFERDRKEEEEKKKKEQEEFNKRVALAGDVEARARIIFEIGFPLQYLNDSRKVIERYSVHPSIHERLAHEWTLQGLGAARSLATEWYLAKEEEKKKKNELERQAMEKERMDEEEKRKELEREAREKERMEKEEKGKMENKETDKEKKKKGQASRLSSLIDKLRGRGTQAAPPPKRVRLEGTPVVVASTADDSIQETAEAEGCARRRDLDWIARREKSDTVTGQAIKGSEQQRMEEMPKKDESELAPTRTPMETPRTSFHESRAYRKIEEEAERKKGKIDEEAERKKRDSDDDNDGGHGENAGGEETALLVVEPSTNGQPSSDKKKKDDKEALSSSTSTLPSLAEIKRALQEEFVRPMPTAQSDLPPAAVHPSSSLDPMELEQKSSQERLLREGDGSVLPAAQMEPVITGRRSYRTMKGTPGEVKEGPRRKKKESRTEKQTAHHLRHITTPLLPQIMESGVVDAAHDSRLPPAFSPEPSRRGGSSIARAVARRRRESHVESARKAERTSEDQEFDQRNRKYFTAYEKQARRLGYVAWHDVAYRMIYEDCGGVPNFCRTLSGILEDCRVSLVKEKEEKELRDREQRRKKARENEQAALELGSERIQSAVVDHAARKQEMMDQQLELDFKKFELFFEKMRNAHSDVEEAANTGADAESSAWYRMCIECHRLWCTIMKGRATIVEYCEFEQLWTRNNPAIEDEDYDEYMKEINQIRKEYAEACNMKRSSMRKMEKERATEIREKRNKERIQELHEQSHDATEHADERLEDEEILPERSEIRATLPSSPHQPPNRSIGTTLAPDSVIVLRLSSFDARTRRSKEERMGRRTDQRPKCAPSSQSTVRESRNAEVEQIEIEETRIEKRKKKKKEEERRTVPRAIPGDVTTAPSHTSTRPRIQEAGVYEQSGSGDSCAADPPVNAGRMASMVFAGDAPEPHEIIAQMEENCEDGRKDEGDADTIEEELIHENAVSERQRMMLKKDDSDDTTMSAISDTGTGQQIDEREQPRIQEFHKNDESEDTPTLTEISLDETLSRAYRKTQEEAERKKRMIDEEAARKMREVAAKIAFANNPSTLPSAPTVVAAQSTTVVIFPTEDVLPSSTRQETMEMTSIEEGDQDEKDEVADLPETTERREVENQARVSLDDIQRALSSTQPVSPLTCTRDELISYIREYGISKAKEWKLPEQMKNDFIRVWRDINVGNAWEKAYHVFMEDEARKRRELAAQVTSADNLATSDSTSTSSVAKPTPLRVPPTVDSSDEPGSSLEHAIPVESTIADAPETYDLEEYPEDGQEGEEVVDYEEDQKDAGDEERDADATKEGLIEETSADDVPESHELSDEAYSEHGQDGEEVAYYEDDHHDEEDEEGEADATEEEPDVIVLTDDSFLESDSPCGQAGAVSRPVASTITEDARESHDLSDEDGQEGEEYAYYEEDEKDGGDEEGAIADYEPNSHELDEMEEDSEDGSVGEEVEIYEEVACYEEVQEDADASGEELIQESVDGESESDGDANRKEVCDGYDGDNESTEPLRPRPQDQPAGPPNDPDELQDELTSPYVSQSRHDQDESSDDDREDEQNVFGNLFEMPPCLIEGEKEYEEQEEEE